MNPLSAGSLLSTLGPYAPAGIFLVLGVESAVPFGFVLPGDTLLLTAGIAAAGGQLSLAAVLCAAAAGALGGAQIGYVIGRHAGRGLLVRSRSQHVRRAVARSERLAAHRSLPLALVGARFLPLARSVIGPLAGALNIPAGAFALWQTVGGLIWTIATTMAGYAVGRVVPGLERFLPLFLFLAAISFPLTAIAGLITSRIRAVHTRRRIRSEHLIHPEPRPDPREVPADGSPREVWVDTKPRSQGARV